MSNCNHIIIIVVIVVIIVVVVVVTVWLVLFARIIISDFAIPKFNRIN